MQADTIAETGPAGDRSAQRRRVELTTTEFMQLGLFRVGYVTDAADAGGEVIVHSADGMAIATVDCVERAFDLADYLGLRLVAVH